MNILPGKLILIFVNLSIFCQFKSTFLPRIAEDVYIKIEDTKGTLTCKEKKKVKKEERVGNPGLVSKSTFFVFCSMFARHHMIMKLSQKVRD